MYLLRKGRTYRYALSHLLVRVRRSSRSASGGRTCSPNRGRLPADAASRRTGCPTSLLRQSSCQPLPVVSITQSNRSGQFVRKEQDVVREVDLRLPFDVRRQVLDRVSAALEVVGSLLDQPVDDLDFRVERQNLFPGRLEVVLIRSHFTIPFRLNEHDDGGPKTSIIMTVQANNTVCSSSMSTPSTTMFSSTTSSVSSTTSTAFFV